MPKAISVTIAGALLFSFSSAGALRATDIEGTVVIKRKLTKPRVTAPVSVYERGVAVNLASSSAQDPLSVERSRVVVYLDGQFPSKPTTAILEQKNRQFVTDTLVVPTGSTVSFPNRDPSSTMSFPCPSPRRSTWGIIRKTTRARWTSTNPVSFS